MIPEWNIENVTWRTPYYELCKQKRTHTLKPLAKTCLRSECACYGAAGTESSRSQVNVLCKMFFFFLLSHFLICKNVELPVVVVGKLNTINLCIYALVGLHKKIIGIKNWSALDGRLNFYSRWHQFPIQFIIIIHRYQGYETHSHTQ